MWPNTQHDTMQHHPRALRWPSKVTPGESCTAPSCCASPKSLLHVTVTCELHLRGVFKLLLLAGHVLCEQRRPGRRVILEGLKQLEILLDDVLQAATISTVTMHMIFFNVLVIVHTVPLP